MMSGQARTIRLGRRDRTRAKADMEDMVEGESDVSRFFWGETETIWMGGG